MRGGAARARWNSNTGRRGRRRRKSVNARAEVSSAGEHAQEELRWDAMARDAGTQWPYRGHSSGVRRNADKRGAEERESPAVGRGV
jgi:hypothetical protein